MVTISNISNISNMVINSDIATSVMTVGSARVFDPMCCWVSA